MSSVKLRKFPYPYEAALAICNDLDNTRSINDYLDMMNFLNSSGQTAFGMGLGLEVGNSIWFYNNTASQQVSYFKNNHAELSRDAPLLLPLLKSGHIDTLHTFGNFDEGGFKREYAERVIEELEKQGIKMAVWVNHGNRFNTQNLGMASYFHGADPSQAEYHFDLSRAYGLRYGWLGKMTHVLGQDAAPKMSVLMKNTLQKALRYTKYRKLIEPPFDLENRLLFKTRLQDGADIWEFQRWVNAWGFETNLDLKALAKQLKPNNLDRLIKNKGFLILYTHFCDGLDSTATVLNHVRKNLEYLSHLSRKKELLVATTFRLLKYYEISRYLKYDVIEGKGHVEIVIREELQTLDDKFRLSPNDLQGLAFIHERKIPIMVHLGNKKTRLDFVQRFEKNHSMAFMPWEPLPYPEL